MNICLVSDEFPPDHDFGGISTITENLAIGFSKKGHRVFVITRKLSSLRYQEEKSLYAIEKFQNHDNINIVRIQLLFPYRGMNFFYFIFPFGIIRNFISKVVPEFWYILEWNLAVLISFREISKKHDIKIVHTPGHHLGGLFISCVSNIPVIVQIQGWKMLHVKYVGKRRSLDLFLVDVLEKYYISRATDYFFASNFLNKLALKWLKNKKVRNNVIPNPYNGKIFRYEAKSIRKTFPKFILFVGRLQDRKGADKLLHAFLQMSKRFQKLELWLVGRDTETFFIEGRRVNLKTYLSLIDVEEGLKSKIKFLGQKSQRELVLYFTNCLFFVMPSLYEPFGLVAVEAMACGSAVIATRVGGTSDFITHNKEGILIEPQVRKIVSASENLIKDKELRIKLGRAAKSRVSSYCETDVVCTEILNLYNEHVQ